MEENKETTSPDVQAQEESSKIGKQFEDSMKKLTALLGGDTLYKPAKIGKGDGGIEEALVLIAKEEKDAKIKEFTDKTRALIKDKRDFDVFQREQKKEFEKKVQEKQKAFNESAKKLFALVEDIKEIEKSYFDTMQGKQ